jgi:Circularly permutated YpsA SLOG family
MSTFTVISGGQTGVDRGALDAALDLGVRCGGWCPAARMAEDGVIPARYPVTELAGARYLERTYKNVEDSDGTLVITFGPPAGGTASTIGFCKALGRPHLIIDAAVVPSEEALRLSVDFLDNESIRRLNVAGPRATGAPRGHAYAYALVRALCERAAERAGASGSG